MSSFLQSRTVLFCLVVVDDAALEGLDEFAGSPRPQEAIAAPGMMRLRDDDGPMATRKRPPRRLGWAPRRNLPVGPDLLAVADQPLARERLDDGDLLRSPGAPRLGEEGPPTVMLERVILAQGPARVTREDPLQPARSGGRPRGGGGGGPGATRTAGG